MYISCRKLYSTSPNSANRGEDKRAKDFVYGGRLRDRQSSQSLKRFIRMRFKDKERCPNSRWWNEKVADDVAKKFGINFNDALELVNGVFDAIKLPREMSVKSDDTSVAAEAEDGEDGEDGEDAEEGEKIKKNVCIRLSHSECEWLAAAAANMLKDKEGWKDIASKGKDGDAKRNKLRKEFLKVYSDSRAPEIAAFGRFIAESKLADMKVDAAFSFSHAIGTSVITDQVDDFVAVDDHRPDSGAAHFDHDHMTASCMFAEMSCNFGVLLENLGGDVARAVETLRKVMEEFVYAVPTGKHTSMFSKPLPVYASFEVLETEFSMMDAFMAPVCGDRTAMDAESVRRLTDVRNRKHEAFEIKSLGLSEVCSLSEPSKFGVKDGTTIGKAISKVLSVVEDAAKEGSKK